MKKFFVLFAAVLTLCTGILLQAGEKYQVLVFGDLHYDSPEVRVSGAKITGNRKREMHRNFAAWKENIPAMLKTAAEYANKNCLFSLQCGDITQGDEGSHAMAVKSFNEVLAALTKDHQKPVYVVRGNHDVRGPGKNKASNILKAYMRKFSEVKFPAGVKDQTSYRMVGKDLYIFFDSMGGSALTTVKKILAAVPEFRYLFFVTHLPVIPPVSNSWLCYRKQAAKQEELRRLLAKHNAIVLAAHTHVSCLTQWQYPEGKITQLISFSVVGNPDVKYVQTSFNPTEHFKVVDDGIAKTKDKKSREAKIKFMQQFRDKFVSRVNFNAAGFNVLHIDDSGIRMDIFSGKDMSKPVGSLKLR